MSFILNGVKIKNPTTFKIERYHVTTMERLANADMTGDLVATKMKFFFTYDAVTAEEMNTIIEAAFSDTLFFTLEYPYQGEQKEAIVYIGSLPQQLHRAGDTTNWVWKGVNFNLIQQ